MLKSITLLLINFGNPEIDSCRDSSIEAINPIIQIWYHTGNKYLINSSVEETKDKYIHSQPWSSHGPYPPKKFDVKIILIDEEFSETGKLSESAQDLLISIKMKYRAGEEIGSRYLLNPIETGWTEILRERLIKRSRFNKEGEYSFFIHDIEHEKYDSDFGKRGYFLSQIVFLITILDVKRKCKKVYEHIYFATY
jgi:hypothetical protein